MPAAPHALEADWLGACRIATGELRQLLHDRPTTAERIEETGARGEGGDRTLVIDQRAEDAVFAQLERLHDEGVRFMAVSEERGEVDFGDGAVRVVIDPLDGSLNAKRGLPAHALSIAVADGPTMADVAFGYVHDFGTGEEWTARREEGVLLDGRPLPEPPGERRDDEGRLEIVAIESADPRWIARAATDLGEVAHRFRALGTVAVALCQLAATRVDGFVTLWRTRAVDVAAAQLIVRESGALVAFPAFDEPLGAPLDLHPHSPVIAARTPEALERLRAVPMEVHAR
jgi:myo-inositol-1(or 4)-monophosphatase